MCNPVHLESVRLQPSAYLVHILIGGAKLYAELVWGEPFVIIRRSFILLVVEQLLQPDGPVDEYYP